jgi:hypothetical protein
LLQEYDVLSSETQSPTLNKFIEQESKGGSDA